MQFSMQLQNLLLPSTVCTHRQNVDAVDRVKLSVEMRKNSVKFKRGQCQRPVEKQSKAFHSTEQMENAQQTVNNHVRDKIRSNFPLQQMLFLKFSTGFLC